MLGRFFLFGGKMKEGNKPLNFDPTSVGIDDACDSKLPIKTDPMTMFLSEGSIARHREYARDLRLKYSILQKSETLLNSSDIKEIQWQKTKKDLYNEAFPLLAEYTLHTLFFSSFTERAADSDTRLLCGGIHGAKLLNQLFDLGKNDNDGGFLLISISGKKLDAKRIFPPYADLKIRTPILAVDLCEHCYFSDYGFDRRRYLVSALSHLDLARISDFL